LNKLLCIALVLAGSLASAQPAPDKSDAKQLMASGLKLFSAKDYLGALAVFKEAYEKFPSSKILLNIGTTLKLLDRKAEAATTYQRYLDSPDADPAKRNDVTDVITDLDKSLGHVAVAVDPPDAEVQVGDEWLKGSRILHLDPGPSTIHVRKQGLPPVDRDVTTTAGQQLAVAIDVKGGAIKAPTPPPPNPPPKVVETPGGKSFDKTPPQPNNTARFIGSTSLESPHELWDAPAPRSRVGAFAMGHVSVYPKVGSAVLVGATIDATPRLELDAAVILGPGLVSSMTYTYGSPPSVGAYAGVNYAFSDGAARPRISAGIPVFISDGARVGARGAAGLEYVASRHLSLVVEVGVEATFNSERDISDPAVVPALAAVGRL